MGGSHLEPNSQVAGPFGSATTVSLHVHLCLFQRLMSAVCLPVRCICTVLVRCVLYIDILYVDVPPPFGDYKYSVPSGLKITSRLALEATLLSSM